MKKKMGFFFNSKTGNIFAASVLLGIWALLPRLPFDLFFLRRLNDLFFMTGIFFLSLFLSTSLKTDRRRLSNLLYKFSYGKIIAVIMLLVFLISSFISLFILDAIPHIQDEIVYLFQAKIFATGKLYAVPNKLKEFFDYEFVINDNNKWYGKYFFGFPLLLSIGVILGYPWIINPLLGAISVLVISLIGKELFDEKIEIFAPLLCLVSPFYLFMSSNYLSHTSALLFSSLFILYFIRSTKTINCLKYPLFSGAALGFSFNIRPYDSILIAIPFIFYGIICLMKREIRIKHVLLFILPVVLFLSFFLLYSFLLTGQLLQTPFNKYCPTDHIGFGKDVGLPYLKEYGHTFGDGLENTRRNLKQISEGLLGWPILTFSLVFIPFFSRGRTKWDWILLFSFVLTVFGYVFYYLDGIAFGARYYFLTVPMLLILMLRGIKFIDGPLKRLVRRISPASISFADNVLPLLIFFLILRNLIFYIPNRVNEYNDRYWNIDRVLEQEVKKANIHKAVIFIKSGNFRNGEAAPNYYGAGFLLNSPTLDDDVIYARDLGDEKNKELVNEFPDRNFYRFIYNNSLITSERNYIFNLAPLIYKFPKPELGLNNFFEHVP